PRLSATRPAPRTLGRRCVPADRVGDGRSAHCYTADHILAAFRDDIHQGAHGTGLRHLLPRHTRTLLDTLPRNHKTSMWGKPVKRRHWVLLIVGLAVVAAYALWGHHLRP